ncbi:hypothetical protein HKCCE3408_11705 [Rhodobacterales bacterium HKCCE3408]|nr:hypothetical protein [Rhodobacterales bacterium HKCCE3408]
MRTTICGTIAALLVATAATAQDADSDAVIFENSVDATVMADITEDSGAATMLFAGWQIAYQLHQDAIAAGAGDAEIEALLRASEAAAAAYEATLVAQNTVQMASVGLEPMTDEMLAEMIDTE